MAGNKELLPEPTPRT